MKKTFTYVIYVLCTFVVAVAAITSLAGTPIPIAHAQTSPATLSGWAWSSNIGWINFNGTAADDSSYGVSMNTTTPSSAPLSGYAWSSNIGWISFNTADVAGCPQTDPQDLTCPPIVNMNTGAVTGWARVLALSAYDGDGWIELSGTNHLSNPNATYNPTTGTYNSGITYNNGTFFGNAWGSDDVGWLSFNVGVATTSGQGVTTCTPPNCSNPVVTLTANGSTNPSAVATTSTVTLAWTSVATNNPPTSCTDNVGGGQLWLSGYVPNASTSGSVRYSAATISAGGTTFDLKCTYSDSSSATVSVTISTIPPSNPTSPTGTSAVLMWLNNDPAKALTSVHIHPSDSVTLNWDGTAFTNSPSYVNNNPSCSGNATGPSSVPSWTNPSIPLSYQALDNSSNIVSLSGLTIGKYSLSLTCSATIIGIHGPTLVSSSSNPVTITVTNSTIHEQ